MELNSLLLIAFFLIAGLQVSVSAQSLSKDQKIYNWGVELEPSAIVDRFGVLKGGAWFRINNRERVSLDVGYGWNDLAPKQFISREVFTEKYSTSLIQAQFIHKWNRVEIFEFYYALGPYFQTSKGSLDRSFFFNSKTDILTTHEGATYQNDRIGLTGDIGIRVNLDIFTLDLRLGAVGFNSDSKFKNVVDPFVLQNFEPAVIKFYQSEGQTISGRPQFKFRFGVRF